MLNKIWLSDIVYRITDAGFYCTLSILHFLSTKEGRNFTSAPGIFSTPICLMIVRLSTALLSSSPIYSALDSI
jgi:hypothetical protein